MDEQEARQYLADVNFAALGDALSDVEYTHGRSIMLENLMVDAFGVLPARELRF